MSDPVTVNVQIVATITAGSTLLPVPLQLEVPLLRSTGKVSGWDTPEDLQFDCESLVNYWLGNEWEANREDNIRNLHLLLQGLASSTSILESIGDNDE